MASPHQSRRLLNDLLAFVGEVLESFRGIPAVLSILGLLVSFFVPTDAYIRARIAAGGGLVCVALVWAVASAGWTAFKDRDRGLPDVIHSRQPPEGYGEYPLLCILEPSDLFSSGDMVTFFHVDEGGLEQAIGLGAVVNRQEDGKIQVVLDELLGEHPDLIRRLGENESAVQQRLLIKPNVQRHSQVGRIREPEKIEEEDQDE